MTISQEPSVEIGTTLCQNVSCMKLFSFSEWNYFKLCKLTVLFFLQFLTFQDSKSVRRPSTISNDFSSETTGLIATKFHIQPPGPLGKKSCSNGLGHMTNMAAMPIYGKNL